MKLGKLDIYATRRTATCAPADIHERSLISIQQGWTAHDWEITVGPWYMVVSRVSSGGHSRVA